MSRIAVLVLLAFLANSAWAEDEITSAPAEISEEKSQAAPSQDDAEDGDVEYEYIYTQLA